VGTSAESNSRDKEKVKKRMQTFWALLRESVILQGTLTLCFTVTVCYLAVTGQPIPELLTQGTMLILGFFFGSKSVVQRKD